MKNIITILLLFTSAIYGQIIDFPDPNFKYALVNTNCVDTDGDWVLDSNADFNNDGEIQVSEAAQVVHLNVFQSNITDLHGIEYFTELINFTCAFNNIAGELNLSNFLSLEYLYCRGNELTKIILPESNTINRLICSDNQLTELDLSFVSGNLIRLEVQNNQLTNLDISNFQLENSFFDAYNNQLTNLVLGNQPHINQINLNWNSLVNLDISGCPAINTLNLENNNLQSLDISNNSELVILYLDNNSLTELDISQNQELGYIYLSNNQLTDFELNSFDSVVELDFSGNLFSEINFVSNSLAYLNFSNNQINNISLNLTYPFSQRLNIENNLITELDLSDTKIKQLKCGQNPNLEYINFRNGYNWDFSYNESSMQDLPLLTEMCIDNPAGSTVLMDWVEDQVGQDVEFYNTDTCDEFILSTEELQENNFSIYPNPTNDMVSINSNIPIDKLEVFNIQGQLLFSVKETTKVNLTLLPSGIYVLKVVDELKNVSEHKIIKE